ncbi:hypothetical protein MRX96_013667 [Rhipicephalus microplus]
MRRRLMNAAWRNGGRRRSGQRSRSGRAIRATERDQRQGTRYQVQEWRTAVSRKKAARCVLHSAARKSRPGKERRRKALPPRRSFAALLGPPVSARVTGPNPVLICKLPSRGWQ